MVRHLLTSLGIPATYLGQRYLIYALHLCLENEDYFSSITKQLYPDVAQHFRVSPASVERDIRTAIRRCWNRGNRSLLSQLAGYPLTQCPSPGYFLSLLAAHLQVQAKQRAR